MLRSSINGVCCAANKSEASIRGITFNGIKPEIISNLIGAYLEADQFARSVNRRQRHINGIPSACNQDTSGTGAIVAGIKSMPDAIQIHLEPRMKIHWRRVKWHINIRQIAAHVA